MLKLKQASINRSISIAFLILAFSSIFSVGFFWIYSEISFFQKSIQQQELVFTDGKKFQLKQEVERAIAYIHYKRSQSEIRLRNDIRIRTNEAYVIANNLYEQNREQLTREQISGLIKDALRPIRFNNGRGYYFATRLDGVEQLFADRPDLEGLNLLEMQDDTGKYVIQDMIELIKREGEGFYRYNWTKPEKEQRSYPKVAFIKYFEPLDWFIGTGEYLDDVNQDIQAEVLSRIEETKFGRDGYIFVGTYDGVSQTKPVKGKNMYNVEDPNGVKIVQELIASARTGGGFVDYVMPQFQGVKNAPKLSYAAGVDEWSWYVGAGIYVGEIEQIIAIEKEKLVKRIYNHLIKIGLTLLFAGLAIFFLVGVFSKKIRQNLNHFSTFFSNSSRNYTPIKLEKIGYR
jgi:signal transduction histidine kinase